MFTVVPGIRLWASFCFVCHVCTDACFNTTDCNSPYSLSLLEHVTLIMCPSLQRGRPPPFFSEPSLHMFHCLPLSDLYNYIWQLLLMCLRFICDLVSWKIISIFSYLLSITILVVRMIQIEILLGTVCKAYVLALPVLLKDNGHCPASGIPSPKLPSSSNSHRSDSIED